MVYEIIIIVVVLFTLAFLCCGECCAECCNDDPVTIEEKNESPIHHEI